MDWERLRARAVWQAGRLGIPELWQEDVVQEALIKIWQTRKEGDGGISRKYLRWRLIDAARDILVPKHLMDRRPIWVDLDDVSYCLKQPDDQLSLMEGRERAQYLLETTENTAKIRFNRESGQIGKKAVDKLAQYLEEKRRGV